MYLLVVLNNNSYYIKMKIKLNKQIDYFVIVVLSLAFTGLLSFFFKINELNTRLLIFIITELTLIVFYETIL